MSHKMNLVSGLNQVHNIMNYLVIKKDNERMCCLCIKTHC